MNNIVFSVELYQLTLIVFFFSLGALWVNIFDREVLSLQMMEAVCLKFMAPYRNSLCTFSAWRCSLTLQQGKDGHCSERGPVCLRGISRGRDAGGAHPPPDDMQLVVILHLHYPLWKSVYNITCHLSHFWVEHPPLKKILHPSLCLDLLSYFYPLPATRRLSSSQNEATVYFCMEHWSGYH